MATAGQARGQLQSDGTFVLTTNKEGDGVVAGHHRVSITGTGKSPREASRQEIHAAESSKLEADVDAEHTEFTLRPQDGR